MKRRNDIISAAINSPDFHCSFKSALPQRPAEAAVPFFGCGRWATELDASNYLERDGLDGDGLWLPNVYPLVHDSNGALSQSHGLFLPRDVRRTGLFIGGSTGSGKNQKLFDVLLYETLQQNPHHSLFIVETTGTLAARIRQGCPDRNVIVLNPSNPNRCERRWNPFHEEDASKLYRKVVSFCENAQTEGNGDSRWFFFFAVTLIQALVLSLRTDHGYADLRSIFDILSLPRSQFRQYLEAHRHVPYVNNLIEFDGCSGSSNFETGVYSAVLMLSTLLDGGVGAFTCGARAEQFDFRQDLFERPTVVILEIAQEEMRKLRPIVTSFVTDLLQAVTDFAKTSANNQLPRQLNIMIDEASTVVGCIPMLAQALNTLRKYGCAFTLASPSLTALRSAYGNQAEALLDGLNSVILLSPTTVEDAEWASKQSGTMTANLEVLGADGSNDTITFRRSMTPTARSVLTPEDVRFGNRKHPSLGSVVTFFLRGCPSFQGWAQPAYEIEAYDTFTRCAAQAGSPLRESPLTWISPPKPAQDESRAHSTSEPSAGISDTRGWSDEQVQDRLSEVKAGLDWESTTGSARHWWENFESENRLRIPLVLRLAEELLERKATITEFFLAYVYSNTDNIQANLFYLDYTRLKKEEERRKQANTSVAGPSEDDFEILLDDTEEEEQEDNADE